MFKLFSKFIERETKVYPYNVKIMDNEKDIVIIEAKGSYNNEFFCFHSLIVCKDEKQAMRVYLLLNENILKEVPVSIRKNNVNNFKFNFKDLIDEETLKDLKYTDSKLLKEGTFINQ